MHGEQKDAFVGYQFQQCGAQQRPAREIERPARLFGRDAQHRGLAFGFGKIAEIHHRQSDVHAVRDDLHRFAVIQTEGGAQGFVAAHHLVHASPQGSDVDRICESPVAIQVEHRTAGREPVHEPHALLGERQWKSASAAGRIVD